MTLIVLCFQGRGWRSGCRYFWATSVLHTDLQALAVFQNGYLQKSKNSVYSLLMNISHPRSEGVNSGEGKMVPFG